MKRTRKMMLVTLMATTAVAMLLMSKAFAAPAAAGNCPTQSMLNSLLGNGGTSLPTGTTTSNCPKTAALQSLLNGATLPSGVTGANCPKNAALQSLLNGAALPASTSGSTCPAKNLINQFLGGKATLPVKTPCPKASAPAATPAPTANPTAPAPTATATPAPTATATVPPVSGSMTADESKMINLVNQDRAANGLKPLTFDAGLRAGALVHSQDMSANNYFSHTSPTQGDFSTRVRAAGVKYSSAGENIAMYPSVEQAEVGFMNSPGHRANILGDFTRVGIGIVYNQSKGEYYITQWFAK